LHRNKRSLTINLKKPDGLKLFLRLAATVDVVVENFRPDVKTRLGIDYDDLKAVNPRIILASISGFGQTGPYAKRPGFDQIAQGMGGLMSITGEPGRGPMRVGIPIADLCTGLFCALGIMTALIERDKSGEGQWLHSSLLQSQLFMLDFQAARWLMAQEVAPQVGNDHPTNLPTGLFKTSDGAVNISAAGDNIFGRLARELGYDEWIDDPDFAHNDARLRNRDKLNALIQEKFMEKTSADWVEQLSDAGVPCGPAYTIDEAFNDPQVKHLGVAQPLHTVPFGETNCVGQPVQLTRTPTGRPAPTPERGEHSDEILSEFGIAADEIGDLRARNII
jgi:formyl-CoA transferase